MKSERIALFAILVAALGWFSLASFVPVSANAHVPRIVAEQDFNGLSAALGKTTVFTPSANGTFRINISVDVPATGSVTPEVDWIDANSLENAQGVNGGAFGSPLVLSIASGNPIAVLSAVSGISGTYNMHVVVEEL